MSAGNRFAMDTRRRRSARSDAEEKSRWILYFAFTAFALTAVGGLLPEAEAQKCKQTDFTLKEKKEITYAAKKEPNQSKLASEISKEWDVEVKRTTVKMPFKLLSKKDAVEAATKAGVPSKRTKLTQAHEPKLDEGVLMWLKQARGQNLPVSGDLIKEKAMKLAALRQIPDFMASDGWFDNFKKVQDSARQRDARDPPKEDALADDS